MDDSRVIYNISRAKAMEKLEVFIPRRWKPALGHYVHFLVVEKQDCASPSPHDSISRVPSDSHNEISEVHNQQQV